MWLRVHYVTVSFVQFSLQSMPLAIRLKHRSIKRQRGDGSTYTKEQGHFTEQIFCRELPKLLYNDTHSDLVITITADAPRLLA